MKEYIEREAALQIICDNCSQDSDDCLIMLQAPCAEYADILRLPAADVRPAVRGKWIDGKGNPVPWDELNKNCPSHSAYCSVCGDWLSASDEYAVKGRFCPNCGADMRPEPPKEET